MAGILSILYLNDNEAEWGTRRRDGFGLYSLNFAAAGRDLRYGTGREVVEVLPAISCYLRKETDLSVIMENDQIRFLIRKELESIVKDLTASA